MAIFSRRAIQRRIDENSLFMTEKQTRNHVEKLNKGDLSAEWEVILLNAFSKFGSVAHEKIGTCDIFFTSNTNSNQQFLADIATIEGIPDEQNPISSFKNDLEKEIRKHGLTGRWRFYVYGNSREVHFGIAKPKLKIRSKEVLRNKQFIAFIEEVKKSPDSKQSCEIKDKVHDLDLSINYEPTSFTQVTGRSFDNSSIVKLEDNQIFSILERKRKQLTKSGYTGCLGIILCDGDSTYLGSRGTSPHHHIRDVIYKFLNNYPEISFVLTVHIEDQYVIGRKFKIIVELYDLEPINKLAYSVSEIIKNELIKVLPKPLTMARNARNHIKFIRKKPELANLGSRFISIGFSEQDITLSARLLLELLSGKISQEDFFLSCGFDRFPNQFLQFLDEGRLIEKVRIEKGDYEIDDDWIIFDFTNEPDVAVSPFEAHNRKKKAKKSSN
jgi:hypothetical protein